MAHIVTMPAHFYDANTGADLGIKVLRMVQCDGNGDSVYKQWDKIDSSDDIPKMSVGFTLCGFSNPTIFVPAGDKFPPQQPVWNVESENVLGLIGMNGSTLTIPDNSVLNVAIWKLKFDFLSDDRYIEISRDSTAIYYKFYNADGSFIGSMNTSCNLDWGTQWGYNRCTIKFGFFPCIRKDGLDVNIATSNSFVAYYNKLLGQNENKRMFIGVNYGGSDVNQETSAAKIWKEFFGDYDPTPSDDDNPYWDGGTSNEGGGDGNFSDDSDNPETDDLPEIGVSGTGFATIFKPTLSQLRSLSELFWNSNVFTFLQNLVENITDMFTSLAMVPFEVTAGNTVSVTWLGIDTAVSLTLAAKQYYEFDMGSINLSDDNRIFTSGSALDYSPFSTLGIYLPFIGYQELDIDECRGSVINLRYRIDILSGTCVAIIRVAGRDIYQFTGNCLTQIPITNENMQSLVTDAVNVGIAAAGAQAAKGTMSAVEEQIQNSGMSAEKSEVAMAHANANLGHSEARLASATANVMSSGKPSFKKSGAISSSASMLAVKQPYLFLTTPRQSIPAHYQRYCGFPSNITGKLSEFSGYTVVEDIRLNDLVATSPEVAEIYQLLKQGVIV